MVFISFQKKKTTALYSHIASRPIWVPTESLFRDKSHDPGIPMPQFLHFKKGTLTVETLQSSWEKYRR